MSPRRACALLGVGNTKLYELIGSGELETYREGKLRRITLRSIAARRQRLLGAGKDPEQRGAAAPK